MSLLISIDRVLQMSFYIVLKMMYNNLKIPETQFNEKNFLCGSMSKFLSIIFTYPFTTVRTRIQQDQFFKN